MKNSIRLLLLSTLGLSTIAYGAVMPSVDVTVADSGGKLAFKGRTNSTGAFATDNLNPGVYVVQFTSKNGAEMKGKQYAVVVSAGKNKVRADVAGEKFGAGGIAMKVEMGQKMKITGSVANTQVAGGKNVKYINGKKYVWVAGETGSNLGGRWVEADSVPQQNVSSSGAEALRRRQDIGDTHQEGFPVKGPGR